ncbi:MAG: beta-phosphoglucomutase [Tenericutes bacterium]|nr:beta-phosphoglucomutase [Mycoplasmatota bacterium]
MIKGVIFDLDGVIVSTDQLHYKSWKRMADKEHIYFDDTINHRLRGISRMASLDIILEIAQKKYTDQEKLELAKYKNDYYVTLLEELSEKDILPGVMNILEILKRMNIKIAIGSSSRNAKKILKNIGLFDTFEAISDGTNISKSKPDPEVFLKAAKMLNISPSESAVVEDALSGIEAAKNAGMTAFATGDAKSSPIKDYDFEDLLEICKK